MPLVSGTRLGPYEVAEPLGKGAMGEVYRARDARLNRDVAIKVLPEHTAQSPDALARFEFEAQAVAALNHPNILALHDVGAAAGIAYAVTELLDGETLRARIEREGPLPPRKALDLLIQFAHGLAAAHAQGVVHRDVKPENLFVTGDGRLKILDFGIAAHVPSSEAASAAETRVGTQDGVLIGTVGYMAPEQVRGMPASTRSDIFSFGLVAYEMLTGSNPFDRGTAAETMAAILRDEPRSLVGVPGVPAVAARVIDRCLEKRPEDRPESLRDLALFLDAAGAQGSHPSSAAGQTTDVRRWAHRGLLAMCALLAIVTALAWGYVRSRGSRAAGEAVAADLARAEQAVLRAQQDRLDKLRLNARLVASFPQLKALFDTDAPTIRDFLQAYQQRNRDTPLLIALDLQGFVLARTDDSPGRDAAPNWLGALRAAGDAGLIAIDGRPYHAALSSAEAGGTIFGSIIAAAPLDSAFAQSLRDITEEEVVLLDANGVPGTSLRTGQSPWESLPAFREGKLANGAADVMSDFGAREIALATEPAVSAVVLASGDDITGSYRGIASGILMIGTAAMAILLAAGLTVIRRIGEG
jgi:hypothetical protein